MVSLLQPATNRPDHPVNHGADVSPKSDAAIGDEENDANDLIEALCVGVPQHAVAPGETLPLDVRKPEPEFRLGHVVQLGPASRSLQREDLPLEAVDVLDEHVLSRLVEYTSGT